MAFPAFDKVLGPITIAANQELSGLALGTKTLIKLTGSAAFHIFGLAGGSNGQVVTIQNVSGGAVTIYTFDNLSGSASSTANRFRHPSGVSPTIGAQYGAISYYYDGGISLWIMTSHS